MKTLKGRKRPSEILPGVKICEKSPYVFQTEAFVELPSRVHCTGMQEPWLLVLILPITVIFGKLVSGPQSCQKGELD